MHVNGASRHAYLLLNHAVAAVPRFSSLVTMRRDCGGSHTRKASPMGLSFIICVPYYLSLAFPTVRRQGHMSHVGLSISSPSPSHFFEALGATLSLLRPGDTEDYYSPGHSSGSALHPRLMNSSVKFFLPSLYLHPKGNDYPGKQVSSYTRTQAPILSEHQHLMVRAGEKELQ